MAAGTKGRMAKRVQLLHHGCGFHSRSVSRPLYAVPGVERFARDAPGENLHELRLRGRMGALYRADAAGRRFRRSGSSNAGGFNARREVSAGAIDRSAVTAL